MKHNILITGAGKGIGRSTALEFARATAGNSAITPHLILVSRTRKDLEEVADTCRSLGASAECITADLADPGSIESLVKGIVEKHGGIDCLVNNAGIGIFKPFEQISPEEFDAMVATNIKGTFLLTQKVFPLMQQNRRGHIFFITSVAAEKAFPTSSAYGMTKFAQKGLAETIRLLARSCNVRITNVMPGAVSTAMWGDDAETLQALMMRPEDVAIPIVQSYLLPERVAVEELVLRPTTGDIGS